MPHFGPGVDSASKRNWDKGGRWLGLTTISFHVSIILKSGGLKLLELSGSVQGSTGIALPSHAVGKL